jgi:aspartate aminotransferase
LEFAVAQSFSKNFGLYGERIGMVHVVAQTATLAARIDPLLIKISRAEITSCPSYGARIVAEILQDPVLHQQWLMDLETMSTRMKAMREALFKELQRHNVKGSWDHLLSDVSLPLVSVL